MSRQHLLWVGTLILVSHSAASAGPIFFGPTPYLSDADIPVGFYAGGSPTALEDFEDGSLDFGITASTGSVVGPGTFIDSVDGDDGDIDGLGRFGRSWFSDNGPTGITFTFSEAVTAAGIVWTDGGSFSSVTFEAFGLDMVSLGTVGPVSIADGPNTGETAEDRFFGVQNADGIIAIHISNSSGGIEVDHVQFGSAPANPVPEPSSLALLGIGAIGMIGCARRRKRKTHLPA